MSVFKSIEGREKILSHYEEKLANLDIAYTSKFISTSFGRTHLICTGNPSLQPLLIVHGSNACAPISLASYPLLRQKYYLIAVDVPGQPTKSSDQLIPMKGDHYGYWLLEVIKELNLKKPSLLGFSLGGLIILKAASISSSSIKEIFLSAPAYIVNGNPFIALIKMFLPMKKYMKTGNIEYIDQFLGELFSENDAFAKKFLADVFKDLHLDFSPVPTISKAKSKQISSPISIFAAEKDLLFPGKKMIKRAKKIFPSLKQTVLFPDSKHVLSATDNEKLQQIVITSSN